MSDPRLHYHGEPHAPAACTLEHKNQWKPEYPGQPRPDNRTFALTQKAIDNGWNPGGRNKVKSYKFYFFLTESFIDMVLEGHEDNPYLNPYRLQVSEYVFNKKFAKALVGPKRYRKLLQGAVLSRSPIDYMYREAIDRKAYIGRRI